MNPDAHWSAAFYKGLDKIQFEDGRDKCMINRDDAAGFRLDTTFTHKQHKAVSNESRQEVTTRTDYVNKYSSVLQVTSYLITATKTTPQHSAGLVKAHILYPKDPSQHAADLVMLENDPDFKFCLKNKPIDCIRVDGAGDEGPMHTEVQFLWTETPGTGKSLYLGYQSLQWIIIPQQGRTPKWMFSCGSLKHLHSIDNSWLKFCTKWLN